jgi:hypothetical protein
VRIAWSPSPGRIVINAAATRQLRSVRCAVGRTITVVTPFAKRWGWISIASATSVLAHPRSHGVAFLLIELAISIRIKALDQIASLVLPMLAPLLEVA